MGGAGWINGVSEVDAVFVYQVLNKSLKHL